MSRWPYNTARWQRLRKAVLASSPLCAYCAELGYTTPAIDVDHIAPVDTMPGQAFDPDNLQPLCKECHSGPKRREERAGHRIGCDADGNPRRGWGR